MEETITITKVRYIELINDQEFLRCLEGAGVDNWDGYESAQDIYKPIEEEEE